MIAPNLQELDIVGKIKDKLLRERQSYAPRCNYASSAGHPCVRKLVYSRLNWQEKLLPEVHSLLRMSDGNVLEGSTIELIRKAGFDVVEQQRPLEWANLQLSGKIEGQIKINGKLVLFEVKTMKHQTWKSINSADDLKNSTKWWIKGYYDQFQLYLLLLGQEFGILFLKSVEGDLKQIIVAIDYEYAEGIAKKLEVVNRCVESKNLPDRIVDRTVCGMCDFRHVCLPNEESDAINIVEDAELSDLLEQREGLKASAKEYEHLDDQIKSFFKERPVGAYLIAGKFQVKLTESARKFVNLPPSVKAQYEEEKMIQRVTITALK